MGGFSCFIAKKIFSFSSTGSVQSGIVFSSHFIPTRAGSLSSFLTNVLAFFRGGVHKSMTSGEIQRSMTSQGRCHAKKTPCAKNPGGPSRSRSIGWSKCSNWYSTHSRSVWEIAQFAREQNHDIRVSPRMVVKRKKSEFEVWRLTPRWFSSKAQYLKL